MKLNRPSRGRHARGAALLLVAGAAVGCRGATDTAIPAPHGHRDDTVETLHGTAVADPYRWLEDAQSAATSEWLARQATYARTVLRDAPRDAALVARLRELQAATDPTIPRVRNGRYFYSRRNDGDVPATLYVRRGVDGEEVPLPPSGQAGGMTAWYLDASADGRFAAYGLRDAGDDEFEVRFFDVDGGAPLRDVLPRGRYGNVSIAAAGDGAFYDRVIDGVPGVYLHRFGDDPAEDRRVFGEGLTAGSVVCSRLSSSGRYLLINAKDGAGARPGELYFRDNWTGSQVHSIVADVEATFDARIAGDTLYVLTDWEAPRRRIFAANLRQPMFDSWTEVIPQGDATIEAFALIGGRLLVTRLEDVNPRVTVHEPDGFPVRDIELPAIGAVSEIGGGTWEHDEAFFTFSAPARPPTVFRYRVSDGALATWAAPAIDVDAGDFRVEQVRYASSDGAEIPMFVARADTGTGAGAQPVLLAAGGGFGASNLPRFDPLAVAWMERGGVWALPAVRGGGELGSDGRPAGIGPGQQQAVEDLIAAAQWFRADEDTWQSGIGLLGANHAGLLAAAAMTQRPDLFAAVACVDPLTDMLRYHLEPSLAPWLKEYGTADDAQQFAYLAAYSPYHRIRPGARYPAVVLITGTPDARIPPAHARKLLARLQAESRYSAPAILLELPPDAADATVEAEAASLSFLLWQTR